MALVNASPQLPTNGVWNNIIIQIPNNPDIPEAGANINGYVTNFRVATGDVSDHVRTMTQTGEACAINTTGEYPEITMTMAGAYLDTFYTLFLNSRGVYFNIIATFYSTNDLAGTTKTAKFSNCKFAGQDASVQANSAQGEINISIKFINFAWLT